MFGESFEVKTGFFSCLPIILLLLFPCSRKNHYRLFSEILHNVLFEFQKFGDYLQGVLVFYKFVIVKSHTWRGGFCMSKCKIAINTILLKWRHYS